MGIIGEHYGTVIEYDLELSMRASWFELYPHQTSRDRCLQLIIVIGKLPVFQEHQEAHNRHRRPTNHDQTV